MDLNLPPKKEYTRMVGSLRAIETKIRACPEAWQSWPLSEVPGATRQIKQTRLTTHMRRNGMPIETRSENGFLFVRRKGE